LRCSICSEYFPKLPLLNRRGRGRKDEVVMKLIINSALLMIFFLSVVFANAQQSGDASDAAKKEYLKSCASCHGKDGKGNSGMTKMLKVDMSALNLTDDATLNKSNDELIKTTQDGHNKMPAYKGKIADKIIAEIADYMRTLK
jgi:mono/diheme cytochrome c family protein